MGGACLFFGLVACGLQPPITPQSRTHCPPLSLFSLNFFRFFKKWRKEEKAKDIQFDWFGCFLLFAEHYGGEPPITHHKGNQPIKPNFIPTYAAMPVNSFFSSNHSFSKNDLEWKELSWMGAAMNWFNNEKINWIHLISFHFIKFLQFFNLFIISSNSSLLL